MHDIFLNQNNLFALIAILLIVISTSTLGVFTLWQKLSYFGDALSHSVVIAVVIANFFAVNQILAIIVFCTIFCVIFYHISNSKFFSKDAITMILSYFCIALAFLSVGDPEELHSFIFGDLNKISQTNLINLAILALTSLIYAKFAFQKLLQINVNEDLAKINGINVKFWQLSFLIILSCTIALAVKALGVFLMTALLILPAAIARIFSNSPKNMFVLTFILSTSLSLVAFILAKYLNLKSGPFIILSFFTIFILSLIIKNRS